MRFEKLSKDNVDKYIEYLKTALSSEPDMMTTDTIDEKAIKDRVEDEFYRKSTSILAFYREKVVGRIEYHFYGCIQDGYRMCYVNWVYVLPDYRHRGIASALFFKLEEDCRENRINQYYLIRAKNENAEKFYRSFENASLSEEAFMRKIIG